MASEIAVAGDETVVTVREITELFHDSGKRSAGHENVTEKVALRRPVSGRVSMTSLVYTSRR
jgi:hypothetical protein